MKALRKRSMLAAVLAVCMLSMPVLAEDATVWTDSTQEPTVDSGLEGNVQEQSCDAPVLTENAQETADTAPEKEPAALRTDHGSYMSGFGQGRFEPQEKLTWAQVCKVIYNLLEDTSKGNHPCSFTDVQPGVWYYEPVTVLASRGILQCDGGALEPNRFISRGDFAVLVSGLVGVDESAECSFTDVPADHASYRGIATAVERGWLKGFTDGTFRPDESLNRAQAVAVFNRILGRSMDPTLVDDADISPFQDVPVDGWYYRDVMEATVPHTNDAVEGDERWKDYLHTYRLTFRDGNSQSVQLVQEGKILERVPATGGTHWLTANGAVADFGQPASQSATYTALYPGELVVAHSQYVNGYTDGKFRPGRQVTRAEAAQMLLRMMMDQSHGSFPTSFTDVPAGSWFARAVTTLASRGIITSGGEFRPNDPITRGEFVEMLTRLSKYTGSAEFTDVSSGDPLYAAISTAAAQGWIKGYPDGSFRPGNKLTRAEAVVTLNRMMGRPGDTATEKQMDSRYTFSDVSKDVWYYQAIMEAATTHDYSWNGEVECWKTYTHYYGSSVSWESSASVVAAASITNSITCTYGGDYTHNYNWDYADSVKEAYVNDAGYTSRTGYLVWVNLQNQKVYVFTGKYKNWKLEKTFICGSGSPRTPTPTGVSYVTYKQPKWYFPEYTCGPVTRFYPNTGYAFHSRLYKYDGSFYDNSIGWPVSEGCIRMLDPDVQYIYDYVPNNSTVVIY